MKNHLRMNDLPQLSKTLEKSCKKIIGAYEVKKKVQLISMYLRNKNKNPDAHNYFPDDNLYKIKK